MPVYNSSQYLKEALESVLAQTWTEWELVTIDDGSTDGSTEILNSYCKLDRRIKLISQPHQGLVPALNNGLRSAHGAYIARLDSDDLALPDRLEKQVRLLDASPEVVIVGCAYSVIDEGGVESHIVRYPGTDTSIRWRMLFYNCFAHSSVMLRAQVIRDHGLAYDEAARHVEDYELWSRILTYGKGMNLPARLIKYRQHSQQTSTTNAGMVQSMSDRISAQNIRRLGISIPEEDVQVLRQWNGKCPRRLAEQDYPRCRKLLEICEAFPRQRGIDSREYHKIKGNILLKIILALGPIRLRQGWKECLSGYLRIGDLPGMISAGWSRLLIGFGDHGS